MNNALNVRRNKDGSITLSVDQGGWILRDREAGNIIDVFLTEAEAQYQLEWEEIDDGLKNEFTPDFYEVVPMIGNIESYAEEIQGGCNQILISKIFNEYLNRRASDNDLSSDT